MNVLWIVVGLLLLWRIVALSRRWRRPDWTGTMGARPRRRPRRHRRLGDRTRRHLAREQARELAVVIASDSRDPVAHLSAGVVLEPGERAWQESTARLSVWGTEATWVTPSRVSWFGRRAQTSGREATISGWRDCGRIDWLITSERIVGRLGRSGELISIWWGGLSNVQVDLDAEVIRLDATNRWRGHLCDPGIAPIAVAAIAACHGPAALAGHPALACLGNPSGTAQAVRGPEPPAIGPGEPVLRLWSSEPGE